MYFNLEQNGLDIQTFAEFAGGITHTTDKLYAHGVSIDSRTAKPGDAQAMLPQFPRVAGRNCWC